MLKPGSLGGYSSESDSGDTVILPEEEWTAPPTPNTMSFLRFLSREGQAGTTVNDPATQAVGDFYSTGNHSASNTTHLNNYPSSLSFLQTYPSFISTFNSGEPGSFSFKECRLLMTRNNQARVQQANEIEQQLPLEEGDDQERSFSKTNSGSAYSQEFYDNTQASENIESHQPNADVSKQYRYIPIVPTPSAASTDMPPSSAPLVSVARSKNREAAKKFRQKKKNYIQRLEQDYAKLQEKYAICCQENEDLKRLILQQLNVNLSQQNQQQAAYNNAPISISSNAFIAPSTNTLPTILPAPSPVTTVQQPIQICLVGVPTTPTKTQSPVLFKLVQAEKPSTSTT